MQGTRRLLLSSNKQAHLFQLNLKDRERLRKIYLEMCEDIFSFCEAHQLCCMLGGGSALGAVRHQGFIPWDDDLDLNMPRRDYNRFASDFCKEFGNKYEIFVPDGKHKATNLFMKVSLKGTLIEDIYTAANPIKTGISVDVFPIEDVPKGQFARAIKGMLSDIFAYAAVSTYIFQNPSPAMKAIYTGSTSAKVNYALRCILGAPMSVKHYSWWYQKFDRFVQSSSESDYCTVPTGRKHFRGELRKKEVFYPLKNCKFEHLTVHIPAQTDRYLRQLYGRDYMTIPPKEKQEKHFYTKLKWTEGK